MVKKGLERHGLRVDVFNDPEAALKAFSPGVYELAILDVKMPKLNGFQLFREIRKRDDKIRVLFFTAYEEYRSEFIKAFPEFDYRRFLKKPLRVDELLEQVERQAFVQR